MAQGQGKVQATTQKDECLHNPQGPAVSWNNW